MGISIIFRFRTSIFAEFFLQNWKTVHFKSCTTGSSSYYSEYDEFANVCRLLFAGLCTVWVLPKIQLLQPGIINLNCIVNNFDRTKCYLTMAICIFSLLPLKKTSNFVETLKYFCTLENYFQPEMLKVIFLSIQF